MPNVLETFRYVKMYRLQRGLFLHVSKLLSLWLVSDILPYKAFVLSL